MAKVDKKAATPPPPANQKPAIGDNAAGVQLTANQQQGVNQSLIDAEQSAKVNQQIAAIGMWASTQAALLKLKTDLNDAMNSFIKGIGSSVKSAAQ